MKRVLSLVLALVLVLGMIPTFAADMTAGQHLFEHEFIAGDGNGNLMEDQLLTREQLAKLILELNGKKEEAEALTLPPSYTDSAKISAWARPYVAYAQIEGLMVGFTDGSFRPQTGVSGQQLAQVLTRALGYEFSWATVVADAADLGIEVATGAALTRGQAFEAMWTTVNTNPKDGDKPLGVVLGKLEDTTPPPVGPLAVDSANAINLKQIVVSFNKAVSKATAEAKANYTFNAADLAAGDVVTLNEDGKSVTITFATEQNNQVTRKLIVETGVKDADGVALAANKTFDVNFTDTTVPFAKEVKQVAPNKIKVFFNEPVKITAGAAFLVDNGTLSAVAGTVSDTAYSIEVTLGASITSGTHTVTINPSNSTAIKDYANFAIPTATLSFEAVVDTTAPTATVVAESQTELTVTFSEEVTGFTTSDIYHTVSGYTANAVTPVAGSSTAYTVTFTTNPLPTGNAVVVIAKDAVTDLFNNKFGAATTYTVPVTADTTAPTVTGVTVTDENTIKVTFSEVVTGSTVASNYVLKAENGTTIVNKAYANANGNPIGTITYANKVATIDFAANLPHANYLLEVKNVKDTAVNPNTVATGTYAFTIVDKTKPTVNSATLINSKKLVVNFSESMAVTGTGSILEAGKYTLAGSALPSGTTLTAGINNSSVVIELPDSHAGVSAGVAMQVGQVADAAGNLTANLATNLTAGANTAATFVAGEAYAISRTQVEFELNKPLQNIVVDDFTVNGSAVTAAVYENKTLADGTTYGAVVTLTVAAANKWNTDATPTVATTGTIETKDTLGTAIATGASEVAIDTMAPAVAVFTVASTDYADIKAYDASGANGKLDRIEITYTENIFAGSVGIQTYTVEGYTVIDAVVTGGNVVRLTVTEKATADTAAAPNVKQVLAIQDDLAPGLRNSKAADSDATASRETIVPQLTGASVVTVTGTANDQLVLTFSESLKESRAEAADVQADIALTIAGVNRSAWLTTVGVLSEDGKSLTFTLNGDASLNDSFSVTYTNPNDNATELVDLSVLANEVATTGPIAGFVTGAVADTTAPTVLSVVLSDASFNAAADTMTITFSEKVKTNFAVATAPTAAELDALFVFSAGAFAGTTYTATDLSVTGATVLVITAVGAPTTPIAAAATMDTAVAPTANDIEDLAGNDLNAAAAQATITVQ